MLFCHTIIIVTFFTKLTFRATPTGVAIRGDIPITAKMTPQQQNIRLQRRWQNAIRGFWVAYLTTLKRELRGCKIAVGGYCSSQQLYFIQISIKIQRSKGERNLPKNRFMYCFLESLPLILKTLASLNPAPYR